MKQPTYYLTDHLCRECGGRILQQATMTGPTGGGNPMWRCADCGKASSSLLPDCLCWCGFHHRQNHHISAYFCLPFKGNEHLRQAFLSCGSDPSRGEVGIVLQRELKKPAPETP